MQSSESYYGSICITDLLEQLKQKHSSFSKSAKNSKIYMAVTVWVNEEKDEYGNSMAIQANIKEADKIGKKFYLGNCKKTIRKDAPPLKDSDVETYDYSHLDLPDDVLEKKAAPSIANSSDDLPF